MEKGKKKNAFGGWRTAAALYVAAFSLVSLLFLERFPYVHSDESWLAGLSRGMLEEGSIGVTEAFFDAKPRYPHAIKTLFHLMQAGMISVFGYSVRTVRLLSEQREKGLFSDDGFQRGHSVPVCLAFCKAGDPAVPGAVVLPPAAFFAGRLL